MVLESLTEPYLAEHRPLEMIGLGILYSSIAMILASWIFREESSLVAVFLTVLAAVPLMYKIIFYEEKKEQTEESETTLLKEHSRILMSLMLLFIGFVISLTLWYVFLPKASIAQMFSVQAKTINTINGRQVIYLGKAAAMSAFSRILFNNLKVLFFCLFFSFFYGAGAIFILTWNASVIAVAIGNFVRSKLDIIAATSGFFKVASYFQFMSLGLLKYLTHGVFEIGAYFIGGLAGGLVSVAFLKYSIKDDKFKSVLVDSSILTVLAILVLFFAAFVEVYLTPLIVH